MKRVCLPPRLSTVELHRALPAGLSDANGEIEIDAGAVSFVLPYVAAGLRAMIDEYALTHRVRFVMPAACASYLRRVDFEKDLPASVELVDLARRREGDRRARPDLIEITALHGPQDVNDVSHRILEFVRPIGDPAGAVVFDVVSELADNAVTHGHSGLPALFTAQTYPDGILEMGLVDHGMGVRASLARNPKHRYPDDIAAIVAAAQPLVSGVTEEQRGYGIPDSLENLRKVDARVILRSGRGRVTWWTKAQFGRTSARTVEPVGGTWIRIALHV